MNQDRIRPPRPALRRTRHTPMMVLCDGVLLLLALLGTVSSFTGTFDTAADPTALLAACVCAAALFLVVASLPKLRWLLWLVLLALLLYGVWLLLPQLIRGEIAVRCAVVNTFAFHWPIVGAIAPIEQLPAATWAKCATLFLLFVIPVLAFLLSLVIVRLHSFWLTFLLTFPAVLAGLSMLLDPVWPALLALLLCWAGLLLPNLAVRHDPAGCAKLTLLALPLTAAGLLLLLLLLPPTGYQRPQWADRAQADITQTVSDWGNRLFDRLPEGDGPIVLAGGGERIDLSGAGPLRFHGGTVLRVESELRGRIYLRGFSAGQYTDGSWELLDERVYDSLWGVDPASSLYSSVQPDNSKYQPMNFPALADRFSFPDKPYAKVTVENVGANPAFVYYPYHILTTPDQLGGAVYREDYALGREQEVQSHTVYIQPGCDPLSSPALPPEAVRAEQRYAAFVSAVYTELPSKMADRLTDIWASYYPNLQALEAQYPDLYTYETSYRLAAAQTVADFLAQTCVYNPDTPLTPPGRDFVLYFLEESQEGYCMHFASAAVLLLRSMGIPARYVSGYVADIAPTGHASVPDYNAHAWVEVYLDGYGWEPVEVTPPYAGGQPGQSGGNAQPEHTPRPTATPRPSQGPGTATPKPTPTPKPQGADAPLFDVRWLLLPAGILALALGLVLRRLLARRGREKRFAQSEPNRCAIAAYLYLRRLAHWGAEVPEAVEELARRAKFSQHVLTPEERDTVLSAARTAAVTTDAALPLHRRLWFRYVLGLY